MSNSHDASECIILLTHRHKMGAEMFAVSRTGDVTRNRSDAKRFSRDQAEQFIRNQHPLNLLSESKFRDYRMFIDPVIPTPKPAATPTTLAK